MKMPKAVLFDMDGLMIDSERLTYRGYKDLCARCGQDLDLETYRKCLGKPVPAIWQVFYDAYGENFPIPRIMKECHEWMERYFEENGVPLKEGVVKLLEYLNENGVPCILATSSTRSRVDKILEISGMGKYFQDVVCGDEVTKGKPNPEIFLTAAKKAGAAPEECLVLEDSEMGILAAADGNIPVICIPDMKDPEPEFVQRTQAVYPSLLNVLDELKKG